MTDKSRHLEQALHQLLLLQQRQSALAAVVESDQFQEKRLAGQLADLRQRLGNLKRRDEEHSPVTRPLLLALTDCEPAV